MPLRGDADGDRVNPGDDVGDAVLEGVPVGAALKGAESVVVWHGASFAWLKPFADYIAIQTISQDKMMKLPPPDGPRLRGAPLTETR